MKIRLQDSLRELGEAKLRVVQVMREWSLEGIEDFLHEKVQNSASQKVTVTLLETTL